MLLTLAKPPKSEFEFKTHDYPNKYSSSTAPRFSPNLSNGLLSSHRDSFLFGMGTPHRGLPPPSAMTLPDPARGSASYPSSLGALPPAPSQWQGAEEGMKDWLAAKSEEEKRKQEEERTKQENLRLDQRRIESRMLETALQGGIPPHLVPIIFAGVAGGSIANLSAEWMQSYQANLQNAQQQQQQQATAHAQSQQLSPELRRETRVIGHPPGPFSAQPQTPQSVLPPTSVLPGQPLPSQSQQTAFGSSYVSGNMSPRTRAAVAQSGHVGAPTSAPRSLPQSQLPRLTTHEPHLQQTPTASSTMQAQQTQPGQQEQASPSIYFHHWVPPTTQQEKSTSSANPPATPSGKYKTPPTILSRQRATSHASDPDYTSSPKKRKAQGPHQAAPPPTSAPQYTSPSFSLVSTSSASTPGRRGHTRARSDLSSRGEGHLLSMSRRTTVSSQTHTDAGVQHRDVSNHRYQQQPRGRDEYHQPHESEYGPPGQRHEGRIEQPGQAGSMAFQNETRQPGPHQPQDRTTVPFPKWEANDM
jgi:hypothetical protein